MTQPLLLQYYRQLPDRRRSDDPAEWRLRFQAASGSFQQQAAARYTEGTLQRLLECNCVVTRRAAALALAHIGTMASNSAIADRLHDADREVWKNAAQALWAIWFRADSDDNNQELQRLVRTRDRQKALTGLDRLTERAPAFAEAFNQRAIVYFRAKEYELSIEDCLRVLELNPHHFGARAGIGQSYLHMRKHRAALRSFKAALRIHPHLDGVAATVRALENALGEQDPGRRDEKK